MKPAKVIEKERRYELTCANIGNILRENHEKKGAVITNKKTNDQIMLKPGQTTKELLKFLKGAGCNVEMRSFPNKRRIDKIDGIKVRFTPLKHDQDYTKGAELWIIEKDPFLAEKNWETVRKWLEKHGVDCGRECSVVTVNTGCLSLPKRVDS